MRGRNFWPAVLVLLLATPAWAADLAKIDRKIGKEPKYEGKPQYALLVFGPEAECRLWLVFDGGTVYLDKNANGDLTEPGEKLESRERIEIAGKNGKSRHTIVRINDPQDLGRASGGKADTRCYLDLLVEGKFQQYAFAHLAGKPEDVRFTYFDGPLTMMVNGNEPVELTRGGDKPAEVYAMIGTKGIDKAIGSTALINNREGFPADVHPVAELEFANKNGGKPVKLTVSLNQRC